MSDAPCFFFNLSILFFFFNDTATTEIYTLSLHDALPIYNFLHVLLDKDTATLGSALNICLDRKSTRLNSGHYNISYAVFCLKKKTKKTYKNRKISQQRAHRTYDTSSVRT